MNEEKTILDFDKDDGIEISKLIEIIWKFVEPVNPYIREQP